MFQNLGEMLLLFVRTLRAMPLAWRHRQKIFDQFFEIGNASLLMVCILSGFIGGVIVLVTGPVLVERGFASSVGGVVGISMCKELSPVMMSILIAGRIGSAMAAEIGSMRVYQEIDALRTMSINPIHYLVLPRLMAIAVALPLLVVFSILVGWGGRAGGADQQHHLRQFRRVFRQPQGRGQVQRRRQRHFQELHVRAGHRRGFVPPGVPDHRRATRHRPFGDQGGRELHGLDCDPRLFPDAAAALVHGKFLPQIRRRRPRREGSRAAQEFSRPGSPQGRGF
jgi:hypothetical protein